MHDQARKTGDIVEALFGDDEPDIVEVLGRIWSHRRLVVWVTGACVVVGAVYCLTATPWYRATARIFAPFYTDALQPQSRKVLYATPDMLINTIQAKYVGALKGEPKKPAFVNKVSAAKASGTRNNLDDCFDLEVWGVSNQEAEGLIRKLVEESGVPHRDEVALRRKVVEGQIAEARSNLDKQVRQAEQITNVLIPGKTKEIQNLRTVVIPQRKKDYRELVDTILPGLQKEIDRLEKELQAAEGNPGELSMAKERLSDVRSQFTTVTASKWQIETDLHEEEFTKISMLEKEREDLVNQLADVGIRVRQAERAIETLQGNLLSNNLSNVRIKDGVIITQKNAFKPRRLIVMGISVLMGLVLGMLSALVCSAVQDCKKGRAAAARSKQAC